MKRVLVAAAIAAAALTAPGTAHASWLGGDCDGAVDVDCRGGTCVEDELDCGMKRCTLWVDDACLLRSL